MVGIDSIKEVAVFAIDPGANGAMVKFSEHGFEKYMIPISEDHDNRPDVRKMFESFMQAVSEVKEEQIVLAYEFLAGGVSGGGNTETMMFGKAAGYAESFCIMMQMLSEQGSYFEGKTIEILPVHPKKWQNYIWKFSGKIRKSSGTTDSKKTSRLASEILLPDLNMIDPRKPRAYTRHDGIVDATLIGKYVIDNFKKLNFFQKKIGF